MVHQIRAGLLALTALSAGPAVADIDIDVFWTQAQSNAAEFGTLTFGSVAQTTTSVTVTDVVMAIETGGESIMLATPVLTLTELGDGALEIRFGDSLRMTQIEDTASFETRFDVTFALDDLVMVLDDAPTRSLRVEAAGIETVEGAGGTADLPDYQISVGTGLRIDGMSFFVSDAVSDASVRDFDMAFDIGAVEFEFGLSEAQDLASSTAEMTLAPMSMAASISLPERLLDGVFDPDGIVISELDLDFGQASGGYRLEVDEDGGLFSTSGEFFYDRVVVSHAGQFPTNERAYMDGRDLIPRDLVASFVSEIAALEMVFDYAEAGSASGDPQGDTFEMRLLPTTASVQIAVDENSVFTNRAQYTTGASVSFVDASSFVVDRRDVYNFALTDMVYDLDMSVPLAGIMQSVMQGLPEGLRYQLTYGLGAMDLDFENVVTQDNAADRETGSVEMRDLASAMALTPDALSVEMSLARAAGAYYDEYLPAELSANIGDVALALDVPLRTQTEAAPFAFRAAASELIFSEGLWDAVDPDALLTRDAVAFSLEAGGDMRANVTPMAFLAMGMTGLPPAIVETLTFDMLASGGGVQIEGTGAFDIEGATPGSDIPVGIADFTAVGLDMLVAVIEHYGEMPDADFDEMMFFLNAFTVATDDLTRTMQVEINDQEHLIVNGQRMQ